MSLNQLIQGDCPAIKLPKQCGQVTCDAATPRTANVPYAACTTSSIILVSFAADPGAATGFHVVANNGSFDIFYTGGNVSMPVNWCVLA